jgi:hypothetical protein
MAHGGELGRADASKILQLFAKVLNRPREELAKELADYFLKNQDALIEGAQPNLTEQEKYTALRVLGQLPL